MLTYTETTAVIQCDKCKRESEAAKWCYNDHFWNEGWVLNKGTKYEHLCYNCLPKKTRQNIDAMKVLFPR